jgi:hypothetical protein
MKKRGGVLVVSLALVFAALIAIPASARPVQDTIYTYYSDSSLTTVVGRLYDMCDGRWSEGTTTQWVDISYGYPCGSGGCDTCLTPESIDGAGICDDGIDNDGDGHIDEVDPGCYCVISVCTPSP